MNNYTFKIKMTCYHCVGEVIKAFSIKYVQNIHVSFSEQLVHINSKLPKDEIIKIFYSIGKHPIEIN
jgi:copper chaperone CopZ